MITKDIVERMKDGHLVQQYLLASFAYYHLHESPMTDDAYDRLCERLHERYPFITHQHKHIIDRDALTAGTGYYLAQDEYPLMVTYGIDGYIKLCRSGEISKLLEPHLLQSIAKPVGARRVARSAPPAVLPTPTVTARPAPRVARRTPPVQAAPPVPAVQSPSGVKRIPRRTR